MCPSHSTWIWTSQGETVSPLTDDEIGARVAADIPEGSYVNLGIGMPTLVGAHIGPDKEVVFHSENGILGMGGPPEPGQEDPDLVDAGKAHTTLVPGASLFHTGDSFAMMRSGALDVSVLGAFQVSARGDLANWKVAGSDAVPAVGGAMDLAAGARRLYVTMRLFDKQGRSKLLPQCTYPLTAVARVSRVYTDHALFDLHDGVVEVVETYGDTDVGALRGHTGIDLVDGTAAGARSASRRASHAR